LLAVSVVTLVIFNARDSCVADPVRFQVQPEASELTFKATSRLQNASGRFHRFAGDVTVDPANLATARVTLSVEAASIDTGITRRDNHLRTEDFFDVDRYPTISFQSVRVEGAGPRFTLVGRLTMRGVTREITVPVSVEVAGDTLTASGEFAVNRQDYGLSYTSFFNPIGDTVRIGFAFRARTGRPGL
jgi:polyisoprenoid-binding protein YceI